jgi:hypothetical protein
MAVGVVDASSDEVEAMSGYYSERSCRACDVENIQLTLICGPRHSCKSRATHATFGFYSYAGVSSSILIYRAVGE